MITVALTELRRRLRSRSAIITSVIGPLALAVVFGLLFDSTDSASFTIGVVDEAGTPATGAIVEDLAGGADDTEGTVTFIELGTVETARDAVDDEVVGAAIVFRSTTALRILRSPAAPLSGQVAESVAFTIAGDSVRGDRPPTELKTLTLGGSDLSAQAYFGASMAILLLFFATGMAAQSILEDKEQRVLDRIVAGPTSIADVLLGKVAAIAVMAVIGFVTVWLVTSAVFGASWGSPGPVFALIVATVIALSGVATFVGGFATTPQQATTLTAVVTFALSLLGGNFTGPADAPAALRAIRGFTPNGRALDAFTEVSVDGASVGATLSAGLILIGFGLVFGSIGLFRLHRTVSR